MTTRFQGKIKSEILRQNLLCYLNVPLNKHNYIKDIIQNYDLENSILKFYSKTSKHNYENLNVEMDKFLLRRKIYLFELRDEVCNFVKKT
jgi:hypothetical protein